LSDGKVVEMRFTVRRDLGMHARPAGQFVTLASRFESEISVARADDDEWVSGRSVLSILSLAAAQGTSLRIRAEGVDAAEAVASLGHLVVSRE
jgi:phosphocarrier protein HPr